MQKVEIIKIIQDPVSYKKNKEMTSSEVTTKRVLATGVTTATSRRRISPRSLSKCQTERARKAKMISKSLFGVSNRAELRE